MSSPTVFLSRLIGLYCIVIALSMMTRRQASVETVTALLQNPSMMLIVGIITLAAGLAMVLAHNIWSGGASVVIVTLVGWITLIKSLLLLFLPPEMEAGIFLGQLHYRQLFYLHCAFSLVLGVYLTYGGFRSRSHYHTSRRSSEMAFAPVLACGIRPNSQRIPAEMRRPTRAIIQSCHAHTMAA